MPDMLGRWLSPAILALIPALFRLLRGRSLAPHRDEPALPERLVAGRKLLAIVFVVALVLLVTFWRGQSLWAVPLEVLSFLAAGWPLRRALFGETWSVGAYLSFYVRLVFVIYGFWIALLASLWITNLDGIRGWAAAAVSGVVLLVWNERYGILLRTVMRTRPVESTALTERFRDIIARTTVAPPHIEYVDMRGGVLINALALPDTRRPSVLFTSTLLERLDPDEVVAVFAHEVAHLEHLSPAYLRKLRPMAWLLICATVSVSPLLNTFAPGYRQAAWLWPFVILAYMIVRGHQRQKHETESDLRAAELTGDPESVVRGLVKLYQLMRMPRRLDPDVEAGASHPSLARRIQAIRGATGTAAAALGEAVILRHASTTVTLHDGHLVWSEGELTAYTLPYAGLAELRVDAATTGATRLVVSDPAGRKWTMPLAGEDVARAQAALDLVDTRLHPKPTARGQFVAVARLSAMLCAVAALLVAQIGAAIVAALAAISIDRPLMIGAGVAGIAGALIGWRDFMPGDRVAILALSAVLMLFLAWRDRREHVSLTARRLVPLIGVLALLFALPIALAGADPLALHQAARAWSSAAVFAMAFAAACVTRRKWWRVAAAAAVLVAAGIAVLGSTRTLDAWLDDPFLAATPARAPIPVGTRPESRSFTLDFAAADLLLSPTATAIAAIEQDEHENLFHVGRPAQTLTTIAGQSAMFVDDRRLIVLADARGALSLRLIDVDRPHEPIWTRSLDLFHPVLSIDRGAGTWQALGFGIGDLAIAFNGSIAGGDAQRREWRVPGSDEDTTESPLAASGGRLLWQSTRFEILALARSPLAAFATWLQPWRTVTALLASDGSAPRQLVQSVLDVACVPAPFSDHAPVCGAFDGSRTHLSVVSLHDGRVTPLATLNGRTIVRFSENWLTGWSHNEPYAFNLESREIYRLEQAAGEGRGFFVAGGDTLGVIRYRDGSATVKLYRGRDASGAPSVK